MCVFKSKVVGLNFHKVENPVESGDYVILAAEDNEINAEILVEILNMKGQRAVI